MSVEYSVGVAYGVVVASGSDTVSEIIAAFCDQPNSYIEDLGPAFKKDYPSIAFDTSLDNWSGSVKENVIFYVKDTFRNINPQEASFDAFYVTELTPSDDGRQEIAQFAKRFGIDAEPGVCIWASIY